MYFLYHSHIIFFTDSHVWVVSLGREALLRVKFKIAAGTSCRRCRNGENVKLPCDISTGLIILKHILKKTKTIRTPKTRDTQPLLDPLEKGFLLYLGAVAWLRGNKCLQSWYFVKSHLAFMGNQHLLALMLTFLKKPNNYLESQNHLNRFLNYKIGSH